MRLIPLLCWGALCAGADRPQAAPAPVSPAAEPAAPAAATPVDIADPTIRDLSWMAGRWAGTMFGKPAEEHWTRPSAGAMVGMYRLGGAGDRPIYELMLIEQEDDGLVLRLRHFSAGFAEIDPEPLVLRLKRAAPNQADFENPHLERPRRIRYRRSADTLTIGLEFVSGGTSSYREYDLRHEAPPASDKSTGAGDNPPRGAE